MLGQIVSGIAWFGLLQNKDLLNIPVPVQDYSSVPVDLIKSPLTLCIVTSFIYKHPS